ncbi:hypothetical protein BpHYR1_015865 [Brachionus plicatilis]|uniref:Uncharacterized protein n=1 Tax=Brachionus plicatilis TaxID=10195 RepID=A0A3M7QAU8_BRAPC|nr:hypothetical protein BpHYR1_015865 [Brachionus plicatilis]
MKTSVRYIRTCQYSRIPNYSGMSLKSSNYVTTLLNPEINVCKNYANLIIRLVPIINTIM